MGQMKGLLLATTILAIFTVIGCDAAAGVAGLQGSQGAQGAPGAAGVQGDAGPQGPQGAQGPGGGQGSAGSQGDQGPIGPAGPSGSQGPQGEAGIKGNPGNPGPGGADGKDGGTGASIISGTAGTSVILSGGGYADGEAVSILANGVEIATATANENGAFSIEISTVGLPNGAHTLSSEGGDGSNAVGVLVIGGSGGLQSSP